MKKVMLVPIAIGMMLMSSLAFAQSKVDDARMQRDIEVAENILSTLIKQQMGKRNFFPMEVEGSYLPGYGVTFHLPSAFLGGMFIMDDNEGNMFFPAEPEEPPVPGQPVKPVRSYTYSYSNGDGDTKIETRNRSKIKTKIASKRGDNADSASLMANKRTVEAAKNFIADYGDLLTQLQPNEKIIITNRTDGRTFHTVFFGGGFKKQNVITVEGTKGEVSQFRQGKITHDQLMNKLHVIDTEVSDELQPDLETLSSIFNRLYSRDLSKTFFCDDNIYYEKLKDYGAVYHMQVYASSQIDEEGFYIMPTVHLNDLDQQARDKKVKELYPEFEKNLKEDVLEYGRTIKSLKDEEILMFDVTMTRCKGCAIPSTLELSVKYSVLKDYSSGKISKDAALAKINLKKGPDQ